MKKVPIGYSDFKRIRTTPDFLYVDKTALIEEFLEDSSQILLVTRPRRFGKTLNLSTLRYFFDRENAPENCNLFDGLKVSQNKKAMAEQGTRPVIYLTFKDCKERSWHDLEQKLSNLLAELVIPWARSKELVLDAPDKEFLQAMRWGKLPMNRLVDSLKFLTRILAGHHQKTPLTLIDEYDVPLEAAWTGGYWEEATTFFRNFFSAGFKDNPYLWRGVITGCLRVARESMFTGLNNLKVSSVSSKDYAKHFGFTVPEAKQLILDYGLSALEAKIESWYNGYLFGDEVIYNPWSILNLMEQKGEFRNYWVNTSENALVKQILGRADAFAKQDLEDLMASRSIAVPLQEQVVFQEIESSPANLWNFFYFTGYLKAEKIESPPEVPKARVYLKIPNLELAQIFEDSVQYWFSQSQSSSLLQSLRTSLKNGDVLEISKLLRMLCNNSLSYFDATGNEPEKFYHGLVLGLMVSYSDIWNIRSNRESGLGRCDLIMSPKNPDHYGIVMEFKTMDSYEDSDLLACAQNAMAQIEKRQYEQELISQGATKILKMGIGFLGKKLEILSRTIQV